MPWELRLRGAGSSMPGGRFKTRKQAELTRSLLAGHGSIDQYEIIRVK